jgi:tetratricopeptide (TPR) repeat protein
MLLGSFYATQKKWEKAIAWVEKAAELQPENLAIQNSLASLHMNSGNVLETKRIVDAILKKDHTDLQARFLKAQLLFNEKLLAEAKETFESIVKDHPNHSRAHHYLGLIHLAQKEPSQAKAELLKTLEDNPLNTEARTLLVGIYLSERSPDLALRQVNELIAKNPHNYKALVLKAKAYFQKQAFDQARQAYTDASRIRSDDPNLYYQMALLDRHERRHEDVLKHLDKTLALKPDHLPAMAAKVSLFMAQGQPSKALSFLEQKILEHGKDPRVTWTLQEMMGAVLLAEKDFSRSESAFKTALALNPDLVTPYLSLARLYLANDETSKAIKKYQEVLEKQPRFIPAHMALGAIYDAVGETSKAQAAYEKALEINPNFAPAANNLAWLLLQQKDDLDRALALAKQAKALLPDDPHVADTIGLAYLEKGFYPSAISEFSDAAEKMPRDPTIWYHLGLAYWKNNERERALEAANKALKIKEAFPQRQNAEKLVKEIEAS